MYAAAISADTYYYIIGFSQQTDKNTGGNEVVNHEERIIEGGTSNINNSNYQTNRTHSTTTGVLSQENLDYYNRDTEGSISLAQGISFDTERESHLFRISRIDTNAKHDHNASLCTNLMTIPRKYLLCHFFIFLYLGVCVIILNTVPGSHAQVYIEPG